MTSFSRNGLIYTVLEINKTVKLGTNASEVATGLVNRHVDYRIVIPPFVFYNETKYEVVEMGSNCMRMASKLPKLKIPATVRRIMFKALDLCYNLTEIDFSPGSKLEYIDFSFLRLYSLTTLVIPASVQTIVERGLGYCKNLRNIYICGNALKSDKVFDFVNDPENPNPKDAQIFVSFDYIYDTFGGLNVTKGYFQDVCTFSKESQTCNVHRAYSFHPSLISPFIIIFL